MLCVNGFTKRLFVVLLSAVHRVRDCRGSGIGSSDEGRARRVGFNVGLLGRRRSARAIAEFEESAAVGPPERAEGRAVLFFRPGSSHRHTTAARFRACAARPPCCFEGCPSCHAGSEAVTRSCVVRSTSGKRVGELEDHADPGGHLDRVDILRIRGLDRGVETLTPSNPSRSRQDRSCGFFRSGQRKHRREFSAGPDRARPVMDVIGVIVRFYHAPRSLTAEDRPLGDRQGPPSRLSNTVFSMLVGAGCGAGAGSCVC